MNQYTDKPGYRLLAEANLRRGINKATRESLEYTDRRGELPKPINVGRIGGKDGPVLNLTPQERAMHMQLLGPTGGGKSKFMEHMLQQDFKAGNGFTLIDPTGKLYNDMIAWIEYKRYWDHREIILLDPNILSHSFGFNPLLFSATKENPAFGTAAMLKAIEQIFRPKGGGGEMKETPRLGKNLGSILKLLSDNNLTLLESMEVIDQQIDAAIIEHILANTDDNTRAILGQLFKKTKQQFEVETESSVNRLQPFLTSPNIRRIFGQQNKTLDFHHIMDDSCVVLCDLSTGGGRTTPDGAQLLGTLLVNEMFVHAQNRTTDNPNAHLLYIDECHRYLNDDIRLILKEARKFGLYAVLAHQNLADLREAGSGIYHAVMTNARNKVVFGGLDYEENLVITQEIFDKEIIRLRDTPIDILTKPTQVGVEVIELESRSKTTGTTETDSWASTSSSGTTNFQSIAAPQKGFFDLGGGTAIETISGGDSNNTTEVEGGSTSYVDIDTVGKSQAYKPVYKNLPTAVRGEEGAKHEIANKLRSLPLRHAAIKSPYNNIAAQFLYVPYVDDRKITEDYIWEVRERECIKLPKLYTPNEVIDQEIKRRLIEVQKAACSPIGLVDDDGVITEKQTPEWAKEIIKEKKKNS